MTQAIKVVYNHPELNQLDQDDHTIYLLADGTRAGSVGNRQNFSAGASYGLIIPGNLYLETISNAFLFMEDDIQQAGITMSGNELRIFNNIEDMRFDAARWIDLYCGDSGSIEFWEGGDRMLRLAATQVRISRDTLFDNTVSFVASDTSNPSFNIPTGVAPTTPTDGDMWSDGTNLFFRQGGVTRTISWT